MNTFVLYFFPFSMDIVVSLLLFVGRHSLAAQGADEKTVGLVPLFYGIGYVLAGPIMRKAVSMRWAKAEMLIAIFSLAVLSTALANVRGVGIVLSAFCIVPFAVSLFFNAFQTFMLGISNDNARPLIVTVSMYTFAWSCGFGIGPFASSAAKSILSWPQTYLVAAGFCILVGAAVIAFKPKKAAQNIPAQADAAPGAGHRPLVVSAWIGMLIVVTGYVVLATYWPIIAAQAGYSSMTKGTVELVYALAQAVGVLMLLRFRKWPHVPMLLPLFALVGICGLIVFGLAASVPVFFIGALLFGLFSSTAFTFGPYHCMLDAKKASRRIAINEMFVGLGFVVGPLLASAFHSPGMPFSRSFLMVGGCLAGAVIVQTVIALRQNRPMPMAQTVN